MLQEKPPVRVVLLLFGSAGLLILLLLAHWQAPASQGYLLTGVVAGLLTVCITTYLVWRKSQWTFLAFILIPNFTHQLWGQKFHPYSSTGFVNGLLLFAQWISVTALTIFGLVLCIVIYSRRRAADRRIKIEDLKTS